MKNRLLAFVILLLSLNCSSARSQTYIFGKAEFGVGNYPFAVATGDFNRDGIVDIAVLNYGDRTVSILLGRSDGTFAPRVDYQVGSVPVALAVGDLNGDQRLDIVVANSGDNTVSVLLGNGNGTFKPHVDYSTAQNPVSVVIGDLNKDHKADLITSNGAGSVSVLLGNGNGTFKPHVDYDDAQGVFGAQQGTLATADFNGDGRLDVVVALTQDNAVSVLLGNGDGTLQPFTEYPTAAQPNAVAVADFNHDGRLDVAVATGQFGQGWASILFGNGDGTFQAHVDYPVAPGPNSILASDLNGNGSADLILGTPNFSVSVLMGKPDGTFFPAVNYDTAFTPVPALADFNRDGHLDLAIAHQTCAFPPCSSPGAVSILLGNGDGTFPAPTSYPTGKTPLSVVTADFNGDGKLDLAVANNSDGTVSIFLGNGDGTFSEKTDFTAGANPSSIVAADLNGDGKIDLAVADMSRDSVSIFTGNGDGTFTHKGDFFTGSEPVAVIAADFNHDGKLDLATANYGNQVGSTVSVLLGNGDGTFKQHTDFTTGTGPSALVAADFNHDGRLDLAVTDRTESGPFDGGVSILLGNGDGTFQPQVEYHSTPQPRAIATADLNGDERLDLVTADFEGGVGQVSVFLGNGDGTFQPHVDYNVNAFANSVVIADFNGDGKLDVAVTQDDTIGFISLLLGNGDGTLQSHLDYASGIQPAAVVAGDFNRDGILDLAVVDQFHNNVSILLNKRSVALFPTKITYTTQLIHTPSGPKTVLVSNPGPASVQVGFHVSGSDPSDFQESDACGGIIGVGQNCTANIVFDPTQKGGRSAYLAITDNTPTSPQKIPLSGTSTVVSLSPSSLNFGDVVVGQSGQPQVITVMNHGSAVLNISNIAVTGANKTDFNIVTKTCGSTLQPGGTCTVTIGFKPTAKGKRTANVSIYDDGGASPQAASLLGTGV